MDKTVVNTSELPGKAPEDSHFSQFRDFEVTIALSPLRNAPQLKTPKVSLPGCYRWTCLVDFLRKTLSEEDIHVYLNNQFEAGEEQCVAELARCFGAYKDEGGRITASLQVWYSVGRAYI